LIRIRYPNDEVLSAIGHLAEEFALYNNVIFDIWNEPYDVEWSELYPVIEKAVETVRAVNQDTIIVVPGTKWSRDFGYISYQPLADAQLVYRVNYDPWLVWTPDDSSYSQLIDPYPWWSNLLGKYPVIFGEFKFLQVPSFSPEQQDQKHREWITHALEIVNNYGLSYTQHELSGWLTGPYDLLHSQGKNIEGAGPYPLSVLGELVFEDLQQYPPTQFR
jgi:hypothetical protein